MPKVSLLGREALHVREEDDQEPAMLASRCPLWPGVRQDAPLWISLLSKALPSTWRV